VHTETERGKDDTDFIPEDGAKEKEVDKENGDLRYNLRGRKAQVGLGNSEPHPSDQSGTETRSKKRLRDHLEEDDTLSKQRRVAYSALIAAALTDTKQTANLIKIPHSYQEAVGDPIHGHSWRQAITKEIIDLAANGTWEECPPPDGINVVTSKWVFAVKYLPNGAIERFKARLVARGFT